MVVGDNNMLNAVPSLILAIILLGVAPMLLGNTICGILRLDLKISRSYVIGYIGLWALIQLVTVPLILLRQSFIIVVAVISVIVMAVIIYGLKKKYYSFSLLEFKDTGSKIAFLVMCVAIVALLIVTAIMQHTDADDTRFVVNAVDIVRTNRMFLTNPATGQSMSVWDGELVKDVTSPWAVFVAYCSKITDIHPTIMAHAVLQLVLTFIMCLVYWMMSEVFFKEDIGGRSIFVSLVLLITVYGNYSVYSAETFAITRIWQGKAVVASIGIPLIFTITMWIYDNIKQIGNYVLLFLVAMAMCHMSGMGIIISVIMTGCISFAYGIAKRNAKVFVGIFLSVIPGTIYYLINSLLR